MRLAFWQKFLGGFGLLLWMTGLYALPENFEKRLAACASCHGEYGHGNPDDPSIARLAQKPAGYLYKQLMSFKAGGTQSPSMEYIVGQLSPEYLQKIARYYASQTVPFQKHSVPTLPANVLARGETLVKEGDESRGVPACQACHGQRLTGVAPMIPGIVNQPFDYVVAQIKQWRTNKRSTQSTHCMWVVANRLKPSDIDAVAAWLALAPVPENANPISLAELPNELPDWCNLEQSWVSAHE